MNVNNSKHIPTGATHINPKHNQGIGTEFYRCINGDWYYYSVSTGQWFTSTNKDAIDSLIPINHQNAWYTKGDFPPAGIECLLSVYSPKRPIEWVNCYVVGLTKDRNAAVVQLSNDHAYSTVAETTRFKPKLTPLEEMIEIFNKGGLQGLIDAGYKK